MKQCIFVETLQEIGFHTLSLMNSTYPSTIWDKSSASYAHTLVLYSVSVMMARMQYSDNAQCSIEWNNSVHTYFSAISSSREARAYWKMHCKHKISTRTNHSMKCEFEYYTFLRIVLVIIKLVVMPHWQDFHFLLILFLEIQCCKNIYFYGNLLVLGRGRWIQNYTMMVAQTGKLIL